MAGASVISAILNAVGSRDLPFVFGGDGALVAVPGSADRNRPGRRWRRCKTWVAEELQLELRAAIVPMGDIRAQGLDVRVARFQASSEISYAMFAGGGASWAEARDEGRPLRDRGGARRHAARPHRAVLPLEPDPGPARRDRLDHRACRARPATTPSSSSWCPTSWRWPASRSAAAIRCRRTGRDIAFADAQASTTRRAPPRRHGKRLRAKFRPSCEAFLAWLFDRLGRSAGGFDPELYKSDVAAQFGLPQVRRRAQDDGRRRRRRISQTIEGRLDGARRRPASAATACIARIRR